MHDDRGQRDELEALQVEAKALKAELALPHSPGFPEEKATRETALRTTRELASQALAQRDRLRGEKAALEARLVLLNERLRIAHQERLGLVMVAVLPSMGLVLWSMQYVRHEAHLAALACAGLFGLTLGPRVVRWVRGDTRAGQLDLGATAAQLTRYNVGLVPFGLAMLATLGPMFLGRAPVFQTGTGPFLGLHLELLVAGLAVVAARRGERLADEGRGTYRGLATAGGVVAFLPLVLSFVVGALGWRDIGGFDSAGPWLAHPARELGHQAEVLVLMVPLALLLPWRLDGLLRRDRRRPWAWLFAGASAVVALLALATVAEGVRTSSPYDGVWSRHQQWVPAFWHAGPLAAWCAAGAALWLTRAVDARKARRQQLA